MLVKLDCVSYCKFRRAYSVSGSHFVDTDLMYKSKVISLRCHSLIMNENLSDGVHIRTNTVVTINKQFHCSFLLIFGAIPPPPPNGPGPPHSRGFCITHSDAPQSIGLLWTSDRLVAETSTWQHTTLTPQAGFEPTIPASERPRNYALDLTVTGIGSFTVPVYYILRKIRVKNMGRGSSAIIVFRLRSEHHRNHNSTAGRVQRAFLFSKLSRPVLVSTQPSIQCVPGALFRE